MSTVLTLRDLGRATLARQMLLERQKATPVQAIERLAGMQAQLARPPYIGLWSRVKGFERAHLTRAIDRREVVRATLMRCTLHLFSAKDYRRMRASLQPALDRAMKGLGDRNKGLDLALLIASARELFTRGPCTLDVLRAHLVTKHPKGDERVMGYAVRCNVPLVQVPDKAYDWGYPGTSDLTLAETWLGAPIDGAPGAEELALRYLAAFGPATPADAQRWSGVPSLKPTFEALRPKLRTFRDPDGRELFDLPKAPRPSGDTPAPVRFLPDYDNLVLGHDDRRRLVADAHRKRIFRGANLQVLATFLVDGVVAGTWKATRVRKKVTLDLAPFGPLTKKIREELAEEGSLLLRFVEPDALDPEIRFGKP